MSSEDEVPSDLALWHQLYSMEIGHWRDVNFNGGLRAHEFYCENGTFCVGETRHEGRETIRRFYEWRRSRGARIARHVVENFAIESVANQDQAVGVGIILLFASDGAPVQESRPPTMLADLRSECRREADGRWRFVSHVLTPIFRGEGRLEKAPG
jgi:SnoaL-like domain